MITVGIDIGSTAVKAALWKDESFQFFLIPTGWSPKESANEAFDALLSASSVSPADVSCVVATGYGRKMCSFANKSVTEITCHAAGAAKMQGGISVLLDIGGQDSKVIATEPDGAVRDFLMNDKCAAGTGRFLQNMAVLLEYTLDEFADIPKDTPIQPISSMCTVFAETEVISLIAKGIPKESIALGLLDSVASRAAGMITRLSQEGTVCFTGGAAKNPLLAKMISKHLGREVLVPEYPQFAGAAGAALIASRR